MIHPFRVAEGMDHAGTVLRRSAALSVRSSKRSPPFKIRVMRSRDIFCKLTPVVEFAKACGFVGSESAHMRPGATLTHHTIVSLIGKQQTRTGTGAIAKGSRILQVARRLESRPPPHERL